MVFRLCYSYTKNESLAEDLLQDCFTKVWLNLEKFRQESEFSTWIYRIAVNTCLTQIRKEKKRPIEYQEEIRKDISEDPSMAREQTTDALYKAISQLAEIDRLIISMVLEGLPQKEMADILGITQNNVSIKVHRIKGQLKKILVNTH